MVNCDYYPLEEAAAELACDESALLCMGANGKLDIAVLVGGLAIVKKTVIDSTGAEVSVSFGGFPGHVVKIERGCIQSQEAGLPARVTLAIYGGQNTGNSVVLTIVDPMEENGDLMKAGDFMMKDAKLVIFADDFNRLQELKTEGGGDVVIEPESINPKKTKPIKGDKDRKRAEHFIKWIKSESNNCLKTQYCMQADLRDEKPELWGKNESTFQTWFKTYEAKEAKELLKNLKLQARTPDKKTVKQETGR